MKKLLKRKKLYVVLTSMLVVGSVTAYLAAQYYLDARAQGWRRDGIAASKSGDHERAAFLLGGYIRREAGDVEALEYYIISRELAELPNGQHLPETANALKTLIGLQPDRLDDRRHLLELYVKMDRRPEALDAADGILHPKGKGSELRADIRTLELKTEVLIRMRKDHEVLETVRQWITADTKDVRAYMAGVAARARLGHPPSSIVADVQLLQNTLDEARYALVQGYALAQTGDDREARDWLQRAAASKSLNRHLSTILVNQFDELGFADEAIAVLQAQLSIADDADLQLMLARRLWQAGQWEASINALSRSAPDDRTADPTSVAMKAIALAGLGKADQSKAVRTALAERPQASAKAWTLLLRRLVDGSAVDDKELTESCRTALLSDPRNSYLDYYLGDANARMGELDHAIVSWRRAAADNPSWSLPAVRLVEALLQKNQPEQAFRVAAASLRNRSNGAAVVALARAWSAGVDGGSVGHAEDLLKFVNEIQRQAPGEDQTLLVQIQLLVQRGEHDKARAAINTALVQSLAEPTLVSMAILSRQHNLGLGDACFTRSEQLYGVTPRLAYGRAIDRHLAGRPNESIAVFDTLAKAKPQDLYWQLTRARLLDATSPASPEALAHWISLGDTFPNDLAVQQAATTSQAVRADRDFMSRSIDRLKALTGETALGWRLAQARMLVQTPRSDTDVEQASIQLNDLIRHYPTLAEPRILMAEALVRLKRIDGAVDQLNAALKIEPASIPVALQLAALLQSRGDYDRVRQELDRVIPRLRSAEQRRQAALLLARQGGSDAAIELLQGGKAADSALHARPDLFLAMLHRQRGDLDKAEAIATELLETDASLPVIQFTASVLSAQGKQEDALKVLARLDGMTLDAGVKELVLGSHRAELADYAGAVRLYKSATEKVPTNAAAWRALAIAYVALGNSDDSIATLRNASSALPADAGFKALTARSGLLSEALLDESLRPVVASVVRQPLENDASYELLQVAVDGNRSSDMQGLAARLQQLVDRRPDFILARLRLVQCYTAMGRVNEAVTTIQQAMAAFANDSEVARVAVQLCATHERWPELLAAAQQWRKRLGTLKTSDPEVATARASVGLRQFAAARSQLEPFLAAAKADPDRDADVLTVYTMALLGDGQITAATSLLGKLPLQSPVWRKRCLTISLAVPDGHSALAWLEQTARSVPDEAVEERVAVAEVYDLLGQRERDPRLVRKAFEMMSEIVRLPGIGPRALLGAAAQAERTGEWKAAEDLYRQVLKADSQAWVAANNLAVLVMRRGGSASEATELAAVAVTQQPRLAAVHDTLAMAQFKAGDLKSAASTMRGAVGLEPDNPLWQVRLAQYLLDNGERSEAAKVLNGIESGRFNVESLSHETKQQLDTLRQRIRPS